MQLHAEAEAGLAGTREPAPPRPAAAAVEPAAPPPAAQWVLRRNCSLTPRQVAVSFAAVAAVTLVLGTAFSLLGYPLVMGFVLLELLALAAALLAYARCAGDRDVLFIEGDRLVVEQWHATRVQRTVLPLAWVQVDKAQAPAVGLRLSAGGQSVAVGRHATPPQRECLRQALRHTLRAHAAGCR